MKGYDRGRRATCYFMSVKERWGGKEIRKACIKLKAKLILQALSLLNFVKGIIFSQPNTFEEEYNAQ